MAYKKYKTYKKAEEAVRKLGGKDKYFILKPGVDESFQVAPRKDFKPDKKAEGGMMNKNLKPVDKKENPGLAKLPTDVRNKMGYMKDGGDVNRAGKLHREYILRTGKKALDSSKGSIYEDDVRKTMKKHYKKAEVGKPKGTPNPGPNPSAKKVSKKAKGGMVLEIGLRPATKSEMKMAKEMKPKKMSKGGMVRGTGAAITGKGFKGVF